MAGLRNNQGYLRAEALKTGELEQYAIIKNGNYVATTLGWEAGRGFYVHHVVRKGSRIGHTVIDATEYHDDIDRARERFRILSNQTPTQRFTR